MLDVSTGALRAAILNLRQPDSIPRDACLLTPRCLASGSLRQPDNLFIAFLTSHDFHFACRYLERPRH
jgi:hypothetical protein